MKIFGLGIPELLIILAVFLVIFGPKLLPKLGSAFGKTAKTMREGVSEVQNKVDESFADEEDEEVETPVRALEEAKPEQVATEEVGEDAAGEAAEDIAGEAAEEVHESEA